MFLRTLNGRKHEALEANQKFERNVQNYIQVK